MGEISSDEKIDRSLAIYMGFMKQDRQYKTVTWHPSTDYDQAMVCVKKACSEDPDVYLRTLTDGEDTTASWMTRDSGKFICNRIDELPSRAVCLSLIALIDSIQSQPERR